MLSAAAILLVATFALAVSTILIHTAWQREGTARIAEAASLRNESVALAQARRSLTKARLATYVSDMRFAFRQRSQGLLLSTQQALDQHVPQEQPEAGISADLRGIEWFLLDSLINSRFRTIGRHGGCVHDVDLFPDGRTVATAGDDGVIRIWNAESSAMIREFHLQDSPVYTVGVSPDGKWLACGTGRRNTPEPQSGHSAGRRNRLRPEHDSSAPEHDSADPLVSGRSLSRLRQLGRQSQHLAVHGGWSRWRIVRSSLRPGNVPRILHHSVPRQFPPAD